MEDNRITNEKFNRAYQALFPIIYRVAYRIVGDQDMAEDMCHEAFMKYYERKEDLPDLDQTKYWLLRVVRNISLNSERKKTRNRNLFDKLIKVHRNNEESGEEIFIKKETKQSVQEALKKLPHKLKVVLVLKEYGDLNYKQIGAIVGISEANVKVRVFRAREKLGQLLKEKL